MGAKGEKNCRGLKCARFESWMDWDTWGRGYRVGLRRRGMETYTGRESG